jgi:WD40 repeat protein
VTSSDVTPLRRVKRGVPRDLDTIIHKAIDREPDRRYSTALEMAEEFRRFLRNEPIRARPISVWSRSWRWCERNPALAWLISAVAVLMFAVTIGSLISGFWMNRLANEARSQRQVAENRLLQIHSTNGLRLPLPHSLPWLAKAVELDEAKKQTIGGGAPDSTHRVRLGVALRAYPKFTHLWGVPAGINATALSPNGRVVAIADAKQSVNVYDVDAGGSSSAALFHTGPPTSIAFSPDSRFIATASTSDGIRVWDAKHQQWSSANYKPDELVQALSFGSNGNVLAAAVASGAVVWNWQTDELPRRFQHDRSVNSVSLSRQGDRLVSASDDHTARIWDLATGSLSASIQHSKKVLGAEFSSDGRHIVTACEDHAARIFGLDGELIGEPMQHSSVVRSARFSADGTSVVTAAQDHTARVWNAQTGRALGPPMLHQGYVNYAEFSPEGLHVVTASDDYTVVVWDAITGRPVMPSLDHNGEVVSAVFDPMGRRILSTSLSRTVRLWDLASTSDRLTAPLHRQGVAGLEFSPNGEEYLTFGGDHCIKIWDRMSGNLRASIDRGQPVVQAAYCPGGHQIVAAYRLGDDRGAVLWWDAKHLRHLRTVLLSDVPNRIACAPAGTNVAVIAGNRLHLITDSDAMPRTIEQRGNISSAAFSPDGKLVASGSYDRMARIWNVGDLTEIVAPLEHEGRVDSVSFSPDGRRLLTASSGEGAPSENRVWEIATGAPPLARREDVWYLLHSEFNADGTRAVTASSNGATVWDPLSGKNTTPTLRHRSMTEHATFSHDRRFVATASWDSTARVWEVTSGQAITHPFLLPGWVRQVNFSPDDRLVAAATRTQAIALYDLAPAKGSAADLLALTELLASNRVDENGGTVALSLDDLLALFQKVRDADLLACNRQSAFGWHLNQANTLIRRRQWAAAHRQLDEAIGQLPNHGPARLVRGELAARLHQWKLATEDFAFAVAHGETSLSTQCRMAVLWAAVNDLNGFRVARQRLLRSLDASLGVDLQRDILRTCLLMPLAPSELSAAEPSIQAVLEASSAMQAETLRVASSYRAGTTSPVAATAVDQPAEVTALERREQLIFKALAARKAGDQRASQFWEEYKSIETPNQEVTDDWFDRLVVDLLEREWAR